jgi:hypothetical protein
MDGETRKDTRRTVQDKTMDTETRFRVGHGYVFPCRDVVCECCTQREWDTACITKDRITLDMADNAPSNNQPNVTKNEDKKK